MTQLINQEVTVNAFYFRNDFRENFRSGQGMKTFPRRMEWNGNLVTFAEAGLRMLVHHGEQLVQLFDMTDGDTTYRLRRDDTSWTLVGTKVGA